MEGLGFIKLNTSKLNSGSNDNEEPDGDELKTDKNTSGLGKFIKNVIASDADKKIPVKTYGGVRGWKKVLGK